MAGPPGRGPADPAPRGTDRRLSRLDPAAEGAARHGVAAPRGLSRPGSRGGRFGRLFGDLPVRDPGDRAIEALLGKLDRAKALSQVPNTLIPAGYTYLGQFIDHDITFDPTSKIERDNDPSALVNFRTPRFDLDSVYGSGPADQPFLYDWRDRPFRGVKLLVGTNDAQGLAPEDLPRNDQGRATIPEARNDENLIVSQLHLLFIRFHNEVVDRVAKRQKWLTSNECFDEAQRIVRWHYQWIVVHDFLDHIVGEVMAQAVRPWVVIERGVTSVTGRRRIYHWTDEPYMPVEFSAAAFRFGHSMVRSAYTLRCGSDEVPILPAPGYEHGAHLGGFRPLEESLTIDWRRFFGDDAKVDSLKIDHCLSPPLFSLPPDGAVLAELNLQRGRALGLPAGNDVARAMGLPELSEDQLLPPRSDEYPQDFWPPQESPDERAALLRAPPLWFYLLREGPSTQPGWIRLGPIGGRIVAEVLVGLLEADPSSYLRRAPAWTPELEGAVSGEFTMRDLIEFTLPPPKAGDDAGQS